MSKPVSQWPNQNPFKKLSGKFTQIPNSIIDDARIKPMPKILLIYLLRLNPIIISEAKLAANLGVDKKTISRAKNSLKKLGILDWIKGNSNQKANDYLVHPPSKWKITPHTTKPNSVSSGKNGLKTNPKSGSPKTLINNNTNNIGNPKTPLVGGESMVDRLSRLQTKHEGAKNRLNQLCRKSMDNMASSSSKWSKNKLEAELESKINEAEQEKTRCFKAIMEALGMDPIQYPTSDKNTFKELRRRCAEYGYDYLKKSSIR